MGTNVSTAFTAEKTELIASEITNVGTVVLAIGLALIGLRAIKFAISSIKGMIR